MADDNPSDDQLDDFIHSYSSPEYDAETYSSDYDDEEASCSEVSSESPADPSAEEEDMQLYDLYDRSARPSPLAPSSPILDDRELILERDTVLPTIDEDPSKSLHSEWRKRSAGRQPPANPNTTGEDPPENSSSSSDMETSEDEVLGSSSED